MYNNAREQRKEIFNDTRIQYESNTELVRAVEFSKLHQRVIAEAENVSGSVDEFDETATVVVSKKRSLEAALKYVGQKVCVLLK